MSDLHFDRALRAAARRGRPEGACPDAAALAAYVDRSLAPAERTALESHVAGCPLCTEHLALLAAVDTSDAPADQYAGWSYARVFGHWRWLVPVATAVLVVAVWLRLPASRETVSTVAPARVEPAEPATRAMPAAPATSVEKDEAHKKAATFADKRAEAQPADQDLKQRRADAAPLQRESLDALKERNREAANERQHAAAAAGARSATADVPAAAPTAVAQAKRDEGAPATAESVRVVPMTEAIRPEPKEKAGAGGIVALRKAAVVPPLVVFGAGVRFRATDGRIERSTDEGVTWTVERTGVSGRLLTGDCPTIDVCWMGGEDGAVFVRTTGGTWIVHRIPDVHADVIAIKATSADVAMVTLTDGRRFATRDAGRTWTRASLGE